MGEIVISVIVPIYNVEQYLSKCIDSLLGQQINYSYEIILVDDGSTDKSGKIADNYGENNENIKSVHKPNGGLSSARNFGMTFAKGEYITFVDSDDYVSDTYLKDLYSKAIENSADIVLTKISLMTEEESKITFPENISTQVIDGKEAFWKVYIQKIVSWSACAKLIKKNILEKYKFPDGYYEDSASMYKYFSETDKIVITDLRNNYHYIRREGSITASKLSQKHMRIFEVCDEITDYLKQTYHDWEYMSALIYQNAVLQLITRIGMQKEDYKNIFNKAVKISRRNLLKILMNNKIGMATKYYAVMLSTNPVIFKIQRSLLIKLKIIKGDWV